MLVSGKQILEYTKGKDIAIPAFGFVNLEGAIAIVKAAEELKMPVILQITEGGMKYGGMENLFYIAKTIANSASVPVAIHYDHGTDIENIKKSIDLGFTSVMYDGSKLPIDENIKNTLEIKNYIGDKDISLEVEIGVIAGKEDDLVAENSVYADIEEVIKINNICDPDMIAVAAGTSHGIYKGPININYDLLKLAAEKTNKPIVLHGLSGVPSDKIKQSIAMGVKKANFDTELKQAYINSIMEYMQENADEYDLRKIFSYAMKAQVEVTKNRIKDCIEKNKIDL